jgi:hypothetical protein
VTKFPSTRIAATCSKKAGDGLTDPFFFFFTGSKVRPPSGPLTMDPELRKENIAWHFSQRKQLFFRFGLNSTPLSN